MNDLNKCLDKMRMLHGLPPHDNPSNTCRGDGYFLNSIELDFDKATLMKVVNLISKEQAIRQVFKDQATELVNKMVEREL